MKKEIKKAVDKGKEVEITHPRLPPEEQLSHEQINKLDQTDSKGKLT